MTTMQHPELRMHSLQLDATTMKFTSCKCSHSVLVETRFECIEAHSASTMRMPDVQHVVQHFAQ